MRTLVLRKETVTYNQDLETGARVFMWSTMVIANIDFTGHNAGEDTAQWVNLLRARLELTLGPNLAHTVRRAYINNPDLAVFGRHSHHLIITHGFWVIIVEQEVDLKSFDPAEEYQSGGRIFKIHRLQAPLDRQFDRTEKFEFSGEDIAWNEKHQTPTARTIRWMIADQQEERLRQTDYAGRPILTFTSGQPVQA